MITPAYALTATERVLPRLALDFTTASLDARVTVTRALNTATRTNASGNIEIVNANLPRFDFNPSTLVCNGLLVEEARTNLLQNSLINGANLSTQSVILAAQVYTLSFYGAGSIVISGGHSATVSGTGAYPARRTLTFTPTAGSSTFTVSGTVQYAQLEAGVFATSFIPTAGASVTRNADQVAMTGTNFSSWYGAGEGAFVVDFGAVNCTEASPGALLSVCDNPLAMNWFLTFITPTAVVNRVRNNGVDQADMVRFGVFTGGSKSAVAYKVDSFASAVGGNAALTDTSGLVPANIAQMKIGAFDPFLTYANGCIRKINYYAPRVTNAETQAFSK